MRASILLTFAALLAPVRSETVTPVQKVVQMMNDMLAKSKKDKDAEMVEFSTYKQFCQSTSAEKTRNIADGKDAIIQLKADIEKAGADALELVKGMEALQVDIDEWGAQKADAEALHAKEKADFLAVQGEYAAAIDAVQRALQVLKSSPGQSFAQVRASLLQLSVSSHSKAIINAFLKKVQHDPAEVLLEESSVQTPKTYESSSGGIIDMVKDLGAKFKEEKYGLEKEFAKKEHASMMVVQDLTDNLERANKDFSMKSTTKSQREKDKAEAEGDLASTTAGKAEDTTFLADLTKECAQRAEEYETNQNIRAGEIEALMKAIEIMSGAAVGGGTKYLPSFAQESKSLAQLRSSAFSPMQHRVASFLKRRAQQANSRILSLIAVRVAEDPFKKIKKMIQDMVDKLMEEANEEAEHKGFCDTEMGTNKNTRDEKSEEIDTLTALIEELTASITKLGEQISIIGDAISAIDAAMAKATAERNEESAKNKAVIADAKVAGEATAQALAVLKEFYAKAAGGAFFTQ